MKADTLRRFLAVHTWTGIITGLALFIAFYAGALIVFADELEHWARTPVPEAALRQAPVPVQSLIDQVMAQHPDAADEFTVAMPDEARPHPVLSWREESGSAPVMRRMRLEESSGDLQEVRLGRPAFVSFIDVLHYTAGLPLQPGRYFFGLVCVLYGLALLSGIVLYAPSFLKDLFALRVGRNLKRLWQDAHNVIGVLSLPFHVMFAWSGAILALGVILLAPFQYLVYDGRLLQIIAADIEVVPHREPAGVPGPSLPFDELLARAGESVPGLQVTQARFHDSGDLHGEVTFTGVVQGGYLSPDAQVVLETASGNVRRVVQPAVNSPGRTFLQGLIELHYGRFAGVIGEWLYFLLGMAGALLFYTGNLLWIEARRRRREPAQPRQTWFMAALTLGVCLGCVAGVSAVFLAGALVPGHEHTVYVAVFLLCVAWSFVRPPARAGHELLWLCAITTALIPVAGFLHSGQALPSSLLHGDWARAGVDGMALLIAAAFLCLARALRKRSRSGDPNSVWSLGGAAVSRQR